jgi:acetyl-CoA carboxylase carboxyl transferase subunit alpha
VDAIVPEVDGGAHLDTAATIETARAVIARHLDEVSSLPAASMLEQRYAKYRSIGVVQRMQSASLDNIGAAQ